MHVIKGLCSRVHHNVGDPRAREAFRDDALRTFEAIHRAEGRSDNMNLPSFELENPRVVVGNLCPDDSVQVRLASLPVARIPDELDFPSLCPGIEFERSCPDGVLEEVISGLATKILRDDCVLRQPSRK